MRYWEIKEAEEKKIVAVMPGGFHPFHPGHKSLYDWAVKTFGQDNVFVAATNDTKSRPFPFDIKQKLAGMAGVPADKFIQVTSPFNALSYQTIIGNPANTNLIFIRSEKDKGTHPLPDQIRKSDSMMGYLVSYKDKNQLETADAHAHIAYGPTTNFDFAGMSIKSATELRNTWPTMSEEEKHKAAELMYGNGHNEAVMLLDKALGAPLGEDIVENITDLNQLASSAQQGLQKVKQGDMRGALSNMEQIANGLAKLDVGTKMYNFMSKMLSAYEQQVANFPEDPDTPKLQKVIDQIQAQMPTMQKQAAQSKQYAKMARNKEVDAFGGLGENITSADIPVVTYDRNYGGDVNKVLAVKRDAKADAEALYKKLGGVSDANYQIISKAAEQKKQELRQVYRDALAKKGIKGAAALKSPEYLLFRKQNADLQIMLGTAMKMSGNGSGKIIKPNGKIIKPGESIEEAEVKPGQSLPKQIQVTKMPTPPQAPTGPDGTGDDGTRIGTTPKGNRSVSSGAGTYIFTPKGKLILYMTPKIGGLQQTHNLQKQTVTVNFGTSAKGATIDQKATYDMSGKLISGDNTSIRSGNIGVSVDKDKGVGMDYKSMSGKDFKFSSQDPENVKKAKMAAFKKDGEQVVSAFRKGQNDALKKAGISVEKKSRT